MQSGIQLGRFVRMTLILLAVLSMGPSALAGLTGCEVVVVVNGQSSDSRTLANHFVALREIPATNVITLNDVPASQVISVDQFRQKILRPVLKEIENRRLSGHVQCITYSAGFPTGINIAEDLKPLENLHKLYTKVGSINGLTYLYASVNAAVPNYIDLQSNYFTRRKIADYFKNNPGGEATREAWSEIQQLVEEEKHEEASQELEELFESNPHQHPLAYFAAAEAALGGNTDKAVNLLDKAIQAGWNAGGYLAKDKRFDSIRDNDEFQILEFIPDDRIKEFQPTMGFDARTTWTPNGLPIAPDPKKPELQRLGQRFLLSTVLGVTRGAGTSLKEAIAALKRSASADFTHPSGTFYFTITGDVRSTTRKWGFLPATELLREMGFGAAMVRDALPKNRNDVLGAQTGTASFNWRSSGSKFLPGAIADNLTSLGGVMTRGSSQTKLTEFIKNGAAGSSGAVTEPYALQDKFPLPLMYVHYARGASLAEAFYSSVSGPYQLLIVGDPVCQPFSNAPQPEFDSQLKELEEGEQINLGLDLSGVDFADWLDDGTKQAERTSSLKPAAISILVDGSNPKGSAAKPSINIKLGDIPVGYHEILFRFIADDPLAQRTQRVLPIWIGDKNLIEMQFPELTTKTDQESGRSFLTVSQQKETVTAQINSTSAKRISLWQNSEELASVEGDTGELSFTPKDLGQGPIRLQAKAELEDGTIIQSLPQWIRIDP